MEKRTVDLAINKQYLAGKWTYREATREIVQNCIDQGAYNIEADRDAGTIEFDTIDGTIGLDKMALGSTTKAGSPELIGQYGEGLKIGMVALLRDGIGIEIHNGEQLWTPIIAQSAVFGCDTLQLEIEDDATAQRFPGGVRIVLSGIDEEKFLGMAGTSIEMTRALLGSEPQETSETDYGTIIRDEDYKGMIFVGGLYVQTDDNLDYGFDFKPSKVELDRDRSVINYYSLMALVAKALIDEGDPDAIYQSYRDNKLSDDIASNIGDASDSAKEGFFEKYLASKRKDGSGPEADLTLENTLLVDRDVNEYLKSHLGAMGYNVRVEEDENIRDAFNEFTDDGKKQETLDDLSEKTDAWMKIKNSGSEMLRYFNDSGYKQMLAIINHLTRGRTAKWITGFLKATVLPMFSKYSFEGILPYIDEGKVTMDPYQLDFATIEKERKD